MKQESRVRFVVDPVWKIVDDKIYERLWNALLDGCEKCGFVGFDMEWSNTRVMPPYGAPAQHWVKQVEGRVATIQLSSSRVTFIVKFIDLFDIVTKGRCDDPFAPFSSGWPHYRIGEKKNSAKLMTKIYQNILSLLQNDNIVKVGVGIRGDQIKFERDYQTLTLRPCVDLEALAKHYPEKELCGASLNILNKDLANANCGKSLKAMYENFTGYTLNKDASIVRSNWGGDLGSLSRMQISYAAADAEASFDICQGIFVRAGLLSGDISSPLSISSTSCLALFEPLFNMVKTKPNAAEKWRSRHYKASKRPSSDRNSLQSGLAMALGALKLD